jgi:hypothetical protein
MFMSRSPKCDLGERERERVRHRQLIILDYLQKCYMGITGWTQDLQHVPAIDDSAVKHYLLQTASLDSASMRTYKLSRPYQMKA